LSTLEPTEKKALFVVKGQYKVQWEKAGESIRLQPCDIQNKIQDLQSHQRNYLPNSVILLNPEEGLASAVIHLDGCVFGSVAFKRITFGCSLDWRGCESRTCKHIRNIDWKKKVLEGISWNDSLRSREAFQNYKTWPKPNINNELTKIIYDGNGNYIGGFWIVTGNALPPGHTYISYLIVYRCN
jgi:hypothetical protein